MITQEMLAQQEVLNGLTAEQIEAITTLSKNDEEVVIGNRFREVYNKLDETIATTTGIARNGDEKTYLYLERAAKAIKAEADKVAGLQTKVNELTNEKNRLEKAIQDGTADEQTKKQLAQAQKDLASVQVAFNTLKTEKDGLVEQHAKELMGIRIDYALAEGISDVKFKAELPEQAVKALVEQAKNRVKGMNPEIGEDGRISFRNEKGETIRSTENQLQPMTAKEILIKELKAMGIVDEQRKVAGGGTSAPAGGGASADDAIVVVGATTQNEADDIITKELMRRGIAVTDKKFQELKNKAWKDNNIPALPLK